MDSSDYSREYIVSVFHISHVTTFSYVTLSLFWAISLEREIVDPYMKRTLQTGGVMVFILFALRFVRYNFVESYTFMDHFLWYAYYIPIIMLPLLSLYAGIKKFKAPPEKREVPFHLIQHRKVFFGDGIRAVIYLF